MMSLSVGYLASGYPDSKFIICFSPSQKQFQAYTLDLKINLDIFQLKSQNHIYTVCMAGIFQKQ